MAARSSSRHHVVCRNGSTLDHSRSKAIRLRPALAFERLAGAVACILTRSQSILPMLMRFCCGAMTSIKSYDAQRGATQNEHRCPQAHRAGRRCSADFWTAESERGSDACIGEQA